VGMCRQTVIRSADRVRASRDGVAWRRGHLLCDEVLRNEHLDTDPVSASPLRATRTSGRIASLLELDVLLGAPAP
jgi:hypothetical protein